jgi:hypothetical protein
MSNRAQTRRMMRAARCTRCGRKVRDRSDFEAWNTHYLNGRVVEMICPDCQAPDEAEEAVHNLANRDYSLMYMALQCRTMSAEGMREYVAAIPDDGERLAPKDTFCNTGSRFVGFGLGELSEEPSLITIWFATAIEPDEENGVRSKDGTLTPRMEILDSEGRMALTDPSPAFMEVPIVDWMGFDAVVVPESAPGQAAELKKIFQDLWERFLAGASD